VSVHARQRVGKTLCHNRLVMIARLLLVPLAMAAASLAPPLQQPFPHEIGPPGVQVQYLGKAHLPKSEKDAIVAVVFKDVSPEQCISPERSLEEEIDAIRIVRAVLHTKAPEQLLVQASDACHCGVTGNCEFWVLERRGKSFSVLLETEMVQRFGVEPSRSNGYRDLITSSHDSAALQGLVLYKFDGKQYRATDCASVEYEIKDDGSAAGPPKLTRMKCGAD
jgi:hypothetical protein